MSLVSLLAAILALLLPTTNAYTQPHQPPAVSRRIWGQQALATAAAATVFAIGTTPPAVAATTPTIYTTPQGIKFAILKPAKDPKPPLNGDIVAIEYTGYLTDGTIFDASHAEGKSNALMFELGGNAVIEGVRMKRYEWVYLFLFHDTLLTSLSSFSSMVWIVRLTNWYAKWE
jgi:hypothetical protein